MEWARPMAAPILSLSRRRKAATAPSSEGAALRREGQSPRPFGPPPFDKGGFNSHRPVAEEGADDGLDGGVERIGAPVHHVFKIQIVHRHEPDVRVGDKPAVARD